MINRAFTLIELLIVIAILGILAAVAVPNFMNAQIRAKIAKCNAEMQSWRTVYEMYQTDHGTFPPHHNDHPAWQNKYMTTPVAYISSPPHDPFQTRLFNEEHLQWSHGSYHADFFGWVRPERMAQSPALYQQALKGRLLFKDHDIIVGTVYYIWSMGPDGVHEPYGVNYNMVYDLYEPSNGLLSHGDIVSVGGGG